MSTNQGQPTLQELMSRVAALEQAHARLLAETTSVQGAQVATGEQKPMVGAAPATTSIQGNFASSNVNTPAVTASGTLGASGVQASSDSGFGVFGQSTSGTGVGGQSTSDAGVRGSSTGTGYGVYGESNKGPGVHGESISGLAGEFIGNVSVSGHLSSGAGTFASIVGSTPAVTANGTNGATGVQVSSDSGIGVEASSQSAHGIIGRSVGSGIGVAGSSTSGIGVAGSSTSGSGVRGESHSGLAGEFIGNVSVSGNVGIGTTTPTAKLEVDGELSIRGIASYNNGLTLTGSSGDTGLSIANTSTGGKSFALFSSGSGSSASAGSFNIYDDTASAYRLTINSSGNVGIGTTAPQAKLDISGGATEGLHIANTNQSPYALMINNTTFGSTDPTGFGLWQGNTGTAVLTNNNNNAISIDSSGNVGIGTTTPTAKLEVAGDINVTGDVVLLGADCAEEFDIAEAVNIEPGTVMVLDQEGGLQQSQRAYDKRVAGVISGAGNYRPGLILDRQQARDNRLPVALVGKVYCKVDARYAPIAVGDLLTTSATPGHAMKADDPFQAFGSVIGKALRPLEAGQGMIPILIALQ